MASSGSSRDDSNTNNNNTNQQNDNIFVQFRRNVDHQISAILHSFIGVPSHMRRNEKQEDNKWQDIEDDRARRIEERAQHEKYMASQQKSGPPATIDRGAGSDDGQEYDIPVQKLQSPVQANTSEEARCPEFSYDYDLYSPFGQNEYERLMAACKIERPAHLRILSGVQERLYCSMLDTHHGNQLSEMGKEKTLMPYLLFSDYSPLRLTHLPPLKRQDMPPMMPFSYAEAFEDLLEMSKNDKSPWEDTENLFAFGASILNGLGVHTGLGYSFRRHPVSSPMSAMEWIATSLVEKDVFRENSLYETIETPIGTFRAGQYSATTEVLLNWSVYKHAYEHAIARDRRNRDDFDSTSLESPYKWPKELESGPRNGKEPRTEQDMYDDFFNTPPAARIKYMDKDEDEEVGILVKTSNATNATTQSFGTQTSVLDHTPQSSPPGSESHKNPWSWSSIQKPSSSEEKVVLISNVPGADSSSSSGNSENGLISHEVTEESETLADGTVKTTVITKKKFGNGKSQVVISTKFDKPAEPDGHDKGETGAGAERKDGDGVVRKVKEWFWK